MSNVELNYKKKKERERDKNTSVLEVTQHFKKN